MRTEKKIVEEYKKADFNDRVILFVTYRDLRDEFMDFELHAYQSRVKEGHGSDCMR